MDAGADLTTLKRHGGWKSDTVAAGYIADSINNKNKICEQISSGLNLPKKRKYAESGNNVITPPIQVAKLANPKDVVNDHIHSSPVEVGKEASDENVIVLKKVQRSEARLQVLYHPDLGLYVPDFIEETLGNHVIFKNCNITINGNNNFTLKKMSPFKIKALKQITKTFHKYLILKLHFLFFILFNDLTTL